MKKIKRLLLVLLTIISLSACGNKPGETASGEEISQPDETIESEDTDLTGEEPVQRDKEASLEEADATEGNALKSSDSGNESANPQTEKKTSGPDTSGEPLGEFKKTATISETVLVDEHDVRITAKELAFNEERIELVLIIENNSSGELSFNSTPYYNSVNNCMVNDGRLYCSVLAGKKAVEKVEYNYDALMLSGITEIANVEVGFEIEDEDNNTIYIEPIPIKTSIADTYDYDKEYFKNIILNDANFSIDFFTDEEVADQSGISIISQTFLTNDETDLLVLEVTNTSSELINLNMRKLFINDLLVNRPLYLGKAIYPGKRAVIFVDFQAVLEDNYGELYGLEEIGSIKLFLQPGDSDHKDIADPIEIDVAVPNAASAINKEGTEIYNKGGIRIVSKALGKPNPEFNDSLYAYLLVENNSGEPIIIREAYGTLAVNDFMLGSAANYVAEIDNGGCAVFIILLQSFYLEEIGITDIEDVTKIETGFLIMDSGVDIIDEPKVTIEY